MAQLADEFDSLRRERDAAVARADELTRDHDRLAALQAELDGSRQGSEQAHQSELSRLAEERDEVGRQVETLRVQIDELLSKHDADRQAHEQALIALSDEDDAARHLNEITAPAVPAEPVPADDGAEKKELAAVQSQLEKLQASHSVVVDALKVAQRQVDDLTFDLKESQTEMQRIRSMLLNMGINLL